jgi:serine protease Do
MLAPAVVNISTERVLVVRERLFGGGSPLEDFFGDLAPRRRVRQTSLGSGVIIDGEGYVVTNAHVVARASAIEVARPGRREPGRAPSEEDVLTHAATLVNIAPEHDLALLQIEGQGPFPRARLARPGDLMIGETVIALGNPFGLESSVTRGVLSASGRSLEERGERARFRDFLQTDAAINPGNSGGPLANLSGEVIGINTAIRADAHGIGFAIPVSRVLAVVAGLLDERELSGTYVGIDLEGGSARVARVAPGSPAQRAGIEPGDEIASVDGASVSWGFEARRRLLAKMPGERARVALRRAGREGGGAAAGAERATGAAPVEVDLEVAAAPAAVGERVARQRLGLQVKEVTPLLAERAGLDAASGVLVVRAERGSPAEAAGVQAGDLLVRVGVPLESGRGVTRWSLFEVPNVDALAQVLGAVPAGGRVLVQVVRDGRELRGEVATR